MKTLIAVAALLALPAHAATIGAIDHQGGRTVLYDDTGKCVGEARRAEFQPEDGKPVEGCWTLAANGSGVAVVLFDARSTVFPVAAVQAVKAT